MFGIVSANAEMKVDCCPRASWVTPCCLSKQQQVNALGLSTLRSQRERAIDVGESSYRGPTSESLVGTVPR